MKIGIIDVLMDKVCMGVIEKDGNGCMESDQ